MKNTECPRKSAKVGSGGALIRRGRRCARGGHTSSLGLDRQPVASRAPRNTGQVAKVITEEAQTTCPATASFALLLLAAVADTNPRTRTWLQADR
jgi:hypothetical protein